MPLVMRSILVLLLAAAAYQAPAQTLNLSHDLISKGVATSNMTPNQPALDSRPLLEAAISYARELTRTADGECA